MTICLGLMNNASVYSSLKYELEQRGHKVITVNYFGNHSSIISEIDYDYVIRKNLKHSNKFINIFLYLLYALKSTILFFKLLRQVDMFIYLWRSYIPLYIDYPIIKWFNKKLVVLFCGDDARWYYSMAQEFNENGLLEVEYASNYNYGFRGLLLRIMRVRRAEKYADVIFSRREQAQLQVRSFYHYLPFHPTLKGDAIKRVEQKKKPLIIHAPSNKDVKGTKYIIKAINSLKQNKEIEFDFKLASGMPREEFQKLLASADIVIDQMLLPGGGRLTTEALANGSVVITLMAYNEYKQGFPNVECPIIDANHETLESVLKETIIDLEGRIEKGEKSVSYVNQNIKGSHFVEKMMKIINGQKVNYDYKPIFFWRYKPSSFSEKFLFKIFPARKFTS